MPAPLLRSRRALALVACAALLLGTHCTSNKRGGVGAPSPDGGPGGAPRSMTPEPAPPPDAAPWPHVEWTGSRHARWDEVKKLEDEQKYEAASEIVAEILKEASESGASEDHVAALIRTVQLRTALHGYETSVRFLKDQPWPEDLLGRSVVTLFFAQSLVTYAQAYSWEIRKRERVDTKGEVDLKKWTMEQIYAAATAAYHEVWQQRAGLGGLPIKTLQAYLNLNNYPEGVRSTLRDAVSYLWVELLANRAGWRPEHANEIYRLDLAGRLVPGKGEVSLVHPEVHPLRRIAAILGDLERWHGGEGRKAAALEARLTRLRQLHTSFTQESDRALLRADLEARLEQVKDDPWWAMGMLQLAEFVRAETAHDALIRARQLGIACREAYPESLGGQRCDTLVRQIEMPAYSIQAMGHDAPGKRSIAVHYTNLTELHFRAYKMDLVDTIEDADDYNLFPQGRELAELLRRRKPEHAWTTPLTPAPDYRSHRHYFVPPMADRGYWVVVASAKQDFTEGDNQKMAAHMIIGDPVVVVRALQGTQEVHVLSGGSGLPVAGADVWLYRYDWRKGHRKVGSQKTDADGRTVFKQKKSGGQYFFIARAPDGQLALDPSYAWFNTPGEPGSVYNALIYTDRSIYRPLQTLHWKVVAYKGRPDQGKLEVAPKSPVTVRLKDPNGEVVKEVTATTNEHGSASGEIDIPTGRLLGNWRLETSPWAQATIKVEEYKRPTFETKLLPQKEAIRLNRPATVKGEARYYFGLPVASGKVTWRVTRTPVYPWWYWSWYWWRPQPPSGAQVVGAGRATLDDEGQFEVTFTPEADTRLGREVSYTYRVSVDVTDEGGETRTAARGFRLGFVAVEAHVHLGAGFVQGGKPHELRITRTNLDGDPAPGAGAWKLMKLKGPSRALLPADQPMPKPEDDGAFRTEGDQLRPRWQHNYQVHEVLRGWADGAGVADGATEHGDDGDAKVTLPALEPGAYRLRYETKDAFGEPYELTKELVVAGKKTKLMLPVDFRVESSSVRVGETARLFVHSGVPGQPLYLDIFQAGKLRERRRLKAWTDDAIVELPVTEADRGGFGVTLWFLRDHQWVHLQQSISVPWDDKQLKVELASFRDKLRPGGKETWTVKVTGPAGADSAVAAAEVLAYMYDRSLEVFATHSPPSAGGLYPWRAGVSWARAALGLARQGWLPSSGFHSPPGHYWLHGDTLQFYSGYGIGGPGVRGGYGGGRPRRVMSKSARAEGAAQPASPAPPGEPSPADEVTALPAATAKSDDRDDDGVLAQGSDEEAERQQGPEAPEVQVRSDFSETAFWEPHLLTGADGSVSFEFEVPDSVTSWSIWIHAITDDMKGGTAREEAKSVKDLMVRPYLPRFVREGDQASLKVVVNNASDGPIQGKVDFDILDPATETSLLAEFGLKPADAKGVAFEAKAGGGTNLSFPITVPARIGTIAFKVIARSNDFSDGELRPLPVLPGRMHLAQSRFVTLKDKAKRTMHFADLAADDDPTRIDEQLVVTVDGQLFYSVLSALPYLIDYPYECTEQTLNRFVSTGILSSLYGDYPAIAKMAKKMSERDTPLEVWDQDDPNRKMALEETPWLVESKGGKTDLDLVKVLDPKVTKATRKASLAKLRKAQTSSGAFPWFPGGPPSPYITLYLLHGFSKAMEFGVDVPKDITVKAWRYMHRHLIHEVIDWAIAHDCCWEFITMVSYVLTNYPDSAWTGGVFTDAERKRMLDFSFSHWKQHQPYLKGYLALTLARMGRAKDATLVWESVMDSAKETEDQGTFWAPEDRSWLWYNDTIETHAFAVRTTMELTPEEPKLDGMVLWLFLNKKLNHWKSTRATAEVLYSLAHYLKANKALGLREETKVLIGARSHDLVFEPDSVDDRKQQIVVAGSDIVPAKDSTIVVEKDTKGFQLASATWHFSTEKLPEEARGDFIEIRRTFYERDKAGREVTLKPLADGAKIAVGDEVEVQISIRTKHAMEYVHLRDPRGAGFEPVSFTSKHKWDLGIGWYEEIRDSGTNFFFEKLPVGEYTFKYRIRSAIAGTFKVSPATIQPMYAPEFTAYSSGAKVTITP